MNATTRPVQLTVQRPTGLDRATGAGPAYVDLCWTPLVGATATAAYRVLTRFAGAQPGHHITLVELADLVGEPADDGMARTWLAVERLITEHALEWDAGEQVLSVPADLPLLTAEQAQRLPASARALHRSYVTSGSREDDLHSITSDGLVAVAALVDEALADPSASPLRAVQRWQQILRTASSFHDDLVANLATDPGDVAIYRLSGLGRELAEAVRRAQRDLLLTGDVPRGLEQELRRVARELAEWSSTDP